MRTSLRLLVVFGLVLAMAGPAAAQRGFGGPGGGGIGMLLNNDSVHKELKLSEDQVQKCKAIVKEAREKHAEDFKAAQTLEGEERFAKMRELGKAVNEEITKAAKDVLTADQMKRLNQIELQTRGANAFTDEEIQKKLNITDDQKEKIKTITEDSRAQAKEIFQNAGDDREGARKKFTALQKETMTKITEVLTDEQKKTWKEMTGEPFEVKFEFKKKKEQA
jgi:Spy/CpxP family protein refolding chaperone